MFPMVAIEAQPQNKTNLPGLIPALQLAVICVFFFPQQCLLFLELGNRQGGGGGCGEEQAKVKRSIPFKGKVIVGSMKDVGLD